MPRPKHFFSVSRRLTPDLNFDVYDLFINVDMKAHAITSHAGVLAFHCHCNNLYIVEDHSSGYIIGKYIYNIFIFRKQFTQFDAKQNAIQIIKQ